MSIEGARIAEFRVRPKGGYGSGYLLGGSCALTAWHVIHAAVEDESLALEARTLDSDEWLPAEVVWWDDKLDAALVKITLDEAASSSNARLTPVRRKPLPNDPRSAQSAGFPRAQKTDKGRDTEQVEGRLLPLSGAREKLPALTVTSSKLVDSTNVELWKGMSGAAVFAGGQVIGHILEVPTQWEGRFLFRPFWHLWEREDFRKKLLANLPSWKVREPLERLVQTPPGSPWEHKKYATEFFKFYFGTEDAPKPFAGREGELRQLDRWLLEDPSPRCLVVGEAGRGKSALLVHWTVQLSDDWRVLFVPVSLRANTHPAEYVLRVLAAQLADATQDSLETPATDPAGYYFGKIGEFMDCYKPCCGRLLIVLDGIDEALAFDRFWKLFPGDLPSEVKVLVSARLTRGHPTAESWRNRLAWPDGENQTHVLRLQYLTESGVADVVRVAGLPLAESGHEVDVVRQLYRLTDGDALLVSLYVEALQKNGVENATIDPSDLARIKPGYAAYFRTWFECLAKKYQEDRNPLDDPGVLYTLGILAHAIVPIGADDIAAVLARVDGGKYTEFERYLRPLERFIFRAQSSDGYSFTHPKLADVLQKPEEQEPEEPIISQRRLDAVKAAFLSWGRETIEALETGKLEPAEAPGYLLHSYVEHLKRVGAPAEDFMAVVANGWRMAWEAREGAYQGFEGDVRAAFEAIRTDGTLPLPRRLGAEIRCALCLGSLRSEGTTIPAELMEAALDAAKLSWQQALRLTELDSDDCSRAAKISVLCASLPEGTPAGLLERVVSVVRVISDDWAQCVALAAIAPHLSEDERTATLADALAAARNVSDPSCQSNALFRLAPCMPDDQRTGVMNEALAAARDITEEYERSRALTVLAPCLSDEEHAEALSDAVRAAQAIGDAYERSEALAKLAPSVSDNQRAEVVREALTCARASGNCYALAILSPYLADEQLSSVTKEALDIAHAMNNPMDRCLALAAQIGKLPDEQRSAVVEEALTTAREITNVWARSEALVSLALEMAEHERPAILAEALVDVRALSNRYQTDALAALAPIMSEEFIAEALAIARAIGDQEYQSKALDALAAHVPEEERAAILTASLAAARAIGDDRVRSAALAELVPRLPQEERLAVVAEALTAARGIREKRYRSEALAALAPQLPKKLLAEALRAARAIDDPARIVALTALASRLPHEERQSIATECLAIARDFSGYQRSLCLAGLVPQLSEEERPAALAEALAAARSVGDPSEQCDAFAALAPHLPEGQLSAVVAEALVAARAIRDRPARKAAALAGLSVHVPEEERPCAFAEALAAARGAGDPSEQCSALAAIAPHLSQTERLEVMKEAIAAARDIRDQSSKAFTLALLAPDMPEEERPAALAEALAEVRAGGDEFTQFRALVVLAPHLAREEKVTAFENIIETMERLPRHECFDTLGSLALPLADLGGSKLVQDIGRTVRDIAQWWP